MAQVVRTLLVEDNPGDARLLRELLSEVTALRAQLTHASKLGEGVELLAKQTFDVLLLDLSLPDAHGIETVTRANAAAPLVPIVVLTGLDDEAVALRAMQLGAQDYLVKGQVDGQLLGRAIRYAMERKRAEETKAARSRFLSEVSRTLAATLDYEATLASVAKLAVPTLADCCLLDLAQDNGELRRLMIATREGVEQVAPPPPGEERQSSEDEPAARALKSREPVLLPEVSEAVQKALRLPARVPPARSVIAIPLVARGRTLGAMTFLAAQRTYDREELALADELAGRAALAIDNARQHRAREEVIGVVSHDLRTPLQVIRSGIENLRDSFSEEALDAVDRAAHTMSRLIQDLLDVTKLDSGTLAMQPKRLGVAVLLEDAEEMLRPVAESKGLTIETDDADSLPFIRADRDRVLQVLWNLVGNAIKFTPEGGKVSLSVQPLAKEARFAVTDTGPGIPEKDLPRVFDRGWQGMKTDKRGAGLGLSIAKGIVEAHGGRIWVTSKERQGSTFFFTLPLDSAATP